MQCCYSYSHELIKLIHRISPTVQQNKVRRSCALDHALSKTAPSFRSNPDEPIILDSSAKPARDSNVTDRLSKIPLKIVTHGWESSADKNAVINIKNAYLRTKDVIVISVDWSSIADSALYPIVAYQTKYVGAYIGHFLDALSDRYNVDGNQIHLIGHSLGAHVMGRAASTSKLTVNRITGTTIY